MSKAISRRLRRIEKLVWTGSVDDIQTQGEREFWQAYWTWAEHFDIEEMNEPEPTFDHLPHAARQRIRTRFENMGADAMREFEELERRGPMPPPYR